ncbi:PucR family transcriptional regulator [Demequina zhanjiangensis]|uniref:PucR family transcriptional regulator n=1 Tax=Demequina zhanjiangensis TaxID=3051659 RepID=A0ABT8FYM5_9MICO|nr:PucR family transcriptional regulator [Demequina sp. SYSU T00b26]MDN4472005.1 PucR family transcriptional regulator [Demequina sp. SYSU T00b26]
MPTTLTTLVEDRALSLTTLVEGDPALHDEPLAWAHSSDLADPTPWLAEGGLLLTDGVSFMERATPAQLHEYVVRLQRARVIALGFAIGIAHDTVPPALIEACEKEGLPLLQVPQATPFMQIIRHVSDAIAKDERARLEASLDAQRAVARAALRPDGLRAILSELELRLGTWVAMFDASGERVDVVTRREVPDHAVGPVTEAARKLLSRGRPGSVRLDDAGVTATLETIGRRSPLRGVLAVGSAGDLDLAGADLVSSVIALAGIALEQSRTLDTARRRLRSGILELLLEGAFDVADSTARALWGGLPSEPLVVTVAASDSPGWGLLEQLETFADRHHGRIFFAERDGQVVAVTARGDEMLTLPFLERSSVRAGSSGPVAWAELDRGMDEAARALATTTSGRPLARFPELAERGVLTYLAEAGGEAVAHRLLAPLLEDPADRQLIDAVGVWLAHLGQWDPASRALGIHRQTLRSRVAIAGRQLGLDLERMDDRAELWAALSLLRLTPSDQG